MSISPHMKIEEVDVDGALREAHEQAVSLLAEAGDTRAGFFRKAGVAGTAAMGSGAMLGMFAGPALAAGKKQHKHSKPTPTKVKQPPYAHYDAPNTGALGKLFGPDDFGIANYALTLEHLENAFYEQAAANVASGTLMIDGPTQAFLKVTNEDEKAHVEVLTATIAKLGGHPIPAPEFNFGETTANGDPASPTSFQQTSYVLENTGVSAYSGQALNLVLFAVVQAAVSIVTIEARHAAVIASLLEDAGVAGFEMTPSGPFDTALGATEIVKAVEGTKFITTDLSTIKYPYTS